MSETAQDLFPSASRWTGCRLRCFDHLTTLKLALPRNRTETSGETLTQSRVDVQPCVTAPKGTFPKTMSMSTNESQRLIGRSKRLRPPRGGWAEHSEDRGFGRNVASNEIDDLDKAAIRYALSLPANRKNRSIAVDLGSGDGIAGIRFSMIGLEAYLYDLAFPSLLPLVHQYPICRVKKIARDMATLNRSHFPSEIDIIYSQRALHYLTPAETRSLMRYVRESCKGNTRAFISVAGFDTEIGKTIATRNRNLDSRHGLPSPSMQKMHNISHPLTIYKKEEIVGLIEETGFKATSVNVSAFGNVKCAFVAE